MSTPAIPTDEVPSWSWEDFIDQDEYAAKPMTSTTGFENEPMLFTNDDKAKELQPRSKFNAHLILPRETARLKDLTFIQRKLLENAKSQLIVLSFRIEYFCNFCRFNLAVVVNMVAFVGSFISLAGVGSMFDPTSPGLRLANDLEHSQLVQKCGNQDNWCEY